MAASPFEAICFYEFSRRKNRGDLPAQFDVVIFHVDDYSVGFCTCSEEGRVTVAASRSLGAENSCADEIDMAFRSMTGRQDGMSDCIGSRLDSYNNKMRTYYQSERQMNPDFKDMLGLELDCAGFDRMFESAGSRLNELMAGIDDLWSDTKFDENECGIIIAGRAAMYYPVNHCIREFFTFDPFLPDSRFLNDAYPDRADEILDIGMRELDERKAREREIYMSLVRADMTREKMRLPVSDPAENETQMKYLEPVFLSAEDSFEFEMNSQKVSAALPYSIAPSDCDVIGIGVFIKEDKPVLRVKSQLHPDRIYDIPVV